MKTELEKHEERQRDNFILCIGLLLIVIGLLSFRGPSHKARITSKLGGKIIFDATTTNRFYTDHRGDGFLVGEYSVPVAMPWQTNTITKTQAWW